MHQRELFRWDWRPYVRRIVVEHQLGPHRLLPSLSKSDSVLELRRHYEHLLQVEQRSFADFCIGWLSDGCQAGHPVLPVGLERVELPQRCLLLVLPRVPAGQL